MTRRFKSIVHPLYKNLIPEIEKVTTNFSSFGNLIYEGRNLLRHGNIGGQDSVVKSFKPPHLINRIAYSFFRQSKAARSYLYALKLKEKGVNTPSPIAYIEEYNNGLLYHSYYISFYSTYSRNMREFWFTPEIGDRLPILQAFARFTARMHEAAIMHIDYSAGNILFEEKNGEADFMLVDVNRMYFGQVNEEMGYHNFARLWLPDDTYAVIAAEYARARGYDERHAVDRVRYYKNKFMSKKQSQK